MTEREAFNWEPIREFWRNNSGVNWDELEAAIKVALAQPERTWVGLTDEEIKEIIGPWGPTPIKGYTRDLFDKIEAKLKEKNT